MTVSPIFQLRMQALWYYFCSVVNAEMEVVWRFGEIEARAKGMDLILVIHGLGIQINFRVCTWATFI